MVRVLCDTSFLIVLANRPLQGVDRLEERLGRIDFIVPSVVIEELKNLSRRAGTKRAGSARLALEAAKNFEIIAMPPATAADDAIADYASRQKCYVATVDNDLKNRLKRNRISVITLAQDRIVVV